MVLVHLCTHSYAQNEKFDSLKIAILNAREDTQKVNLINEYADDLNWSYPDTSVKYSMQGLELSRRLDYKQGEWACLKDLGFAFPNMGNYTSSLDYLYQSLDLANNLKDTNDILWSYVGLAICYRELGDFSKAENSVEKARSLLNPNDGSWWHAGWDELVSGIFEQDNKLDAALFYANRAYPERKKHGYFLFQLGNIHSKLGHDVLALQFYKEAIPLESEANAPKDVIDIYNGIASLYWKERQPDSAIYYSKLALGRQLGITFPIGTFRASGLLAEIYESQKKTDSALKYLKLNISLKDSLFNQQKIRQAQNFEFNQQIRQQDLISRQKENQNRLRMLALASALLIVLVAGFSLWRNNRHKQKANILLQQEKGKVESTLAELKSTQAQLIQQEKMASLGELTAGIAHEIQNPLNFVNNFSEVNTELVDELKKELTTNNQKQAIDIANNIRDNEEKINFHGKRADAIVKGMLQHSRTSSGQKELTDINALCEEYVRLAYHGLRAKDKSFNAQFETDFDSYLPKISVVPQDIGRVILNLINNAFYAVSEKQKLLADSYKPLVSVSTKKLGDEVCLQVKDNGGGIPQNVVGKIFQPFFTTKPTGQGTGLGLSLSYDIIKSHGGDIGVETKEGEGTAFLITLPA